jgi:hypothetical protein
MSIVKTANIDFSKVTFSDVKKLGKGKMVYANLNTNKIILQTPKMSIPFGISRWRDANADDGSGDSFRLGLSFYGEDNNAEIKEFKHHLEQFDNIIKQKIKENSKEWLNKSNVSMEVIEDAYYVPNVKVSVDKDGKEYPSRIEVKLDRQKEDDEFTGKFVSNKRFNHEIMVFDEDKNLVELNESNFESVVPKGSQAICIIELVYISITAKISCKWKLVQMKVFKNKKAITDYAIVDDDDIKDTELKDDFDSEEEIKIDCIDEELVSEPSESNESINEELIEKVDNIQLVEPSVVEKVSVPKRKCKKITI